MPTDKELRDAAVAELKLTTVGWNKVKNFSAAQLATTHWGKAMSLLDQIGGIAPSPPPPGGTVLYDGGFDIGSMSQWNGINQIAPDRFRAVTSDAGVLPRQGSHMGRVETRSGDYTSWTTSREGPLAQKDSIPGAQLGVDVYTGFSIFLPNGFSHVAEPSGEGLANTIIEWHTTPPMSQAPIHFFLDGRSGQGGAFSLDLHTAVDGYNPIPAYGGWKFGSLVTGRWVDFVFRTKWATDSSGIIEGWMDGTKRFSWTGKTWGDAVTFMYLVSGYYRGVWPSTAIFYLDAIKVGTSYQSVAP